VQIPQPPGEQLRQLHAHFRVILDQILEDDPVQAERGAVLDRDHLLEQWRLPDRLADEGNLPFTVRSATSSTP
jgi:hypothetical protein